MSDILYTTDGYNLAIQNKLFNDNLILEIYSNYNNLTFQEKLNILDMIEGLRQINDEYEKYIIVYNSIAAKKNIRHQYVVRQGDTLQRIAQEQTGDFNNWSTIYKYNDLSDLLLVVGSSLLIPENILLNAN